MCIRDSYTVIIVQDLYGKPKDEKSQGESFDVSDMTDEEESIAVSIDLSTVAILLDAR